MPTVTLNSGKSFEAQRGSSILESAASAKISLPFSCKTGRCSACKCRVISGLTYPILREDCLSDEEKLNGWILSCCRSIETDILLNVEDLSEFKLQAPKTLPCRVAKIKKLSHSVIQVFLRLPPGTVFDFLPGQYIDLIGMNGIRRSYSIANSNIASNGIELHIGAVDGGVMSEYWFKSAKENDLLRLYGPLGTFFLRKLSGLNLVFLITGTGISPAKAMLESLVNISSDYAPHSVTVFWGARIAEDLYFDVPAIAGDFKYVPVLSRPAGDWTGEIGYVQNIFLLRKPDLDRTVVFACGSDAMIRSAKLSLLSAGLPDNRFFSDAFVSSAPE